MLIQQLSVTELQHKLHHKTPLFLLDVRELQEFQYAHIANSVLIPLNQLAQRLDELNKNDDIVVICHHGVRSQHAAEHLVYSGFNHVSNLAGGIDAWAHVCDNTIRRY